MGMPRSGTTLVEQVLASHSRVHGAGELRLARQTFEAIPAVVGRDDPLPMCLAALDGAGVAELAQRHLDALSECVSRDRPGITPDRVVDKMPDNYLYLGFLSLLFPHATLIHVRRDPRDIAMSCWMTNFRSIRWANDLDHLARRFEGHRRMIDHWRAVLQVPFHEVVYEQLVDDFETEAQAIGRALRPRLGARLSSVSRDAAAGSHRQHHPGAAADLQKVGGTVEALRRVPEAIV